MEGRQRGRGRPELGAGSPCGPALGAQARAPDSVHCSENSLLSCCRTHSSARCTSTWTGRCSEKPTRSPAWGVTDTDWRGHSTWRPWKDWSFETAKKVSARPREAGCLSRGLLAEAGKACPLGLWAPDWLVPGPQLSCLRRRASAIIALPSLLMRKSWVTMGPLLTDLQCCM